MQISNTKVKVIGDLFRSLVATERIRMGEEILTIPTTVISVPDKYSIEIVPGIHVKCDDSPVGAINHSCDPSAAVRSGKIIAWKCIQPDEAITIDYKKTEQKLSEPFDCVCGSKFCRGRIE